MFCLVGTLDDFNALVVDVTNRETCCMRCLFLTEVGRLHEFLFAIYT